MSTKRPRRIVNIEHDGQCFDNRQNGSGIKKKLHAGKYVLHNGILTERVHGPNNVDNNYLSSENYIALSLSGNIVL